MRDSRPKQNSHLRDPAVAYCALLHQVLFCCFQNGRVKVSNARNQFGHMHNANLPNLVCRQELLAWLNNLLQLNVTKVEQCGTGYVVSILC